MTYANVTRIIQSAVDLRCYVTYANVTRIIQSAVDLRCSAKTHLMSEHEFYELCKSGGRCFFLVNWLRFKRVTTKVCIKY